MVSYSWIVGNQLFEGYKKEKKEEKKGVVMSDKCIKIGFKTGILVRLVFISWLDWNIKTADIVKKINTSHVCQTARREVE